MNDREANTCLYAIQESDTYGELCKCANKFKEFFELRDVEGAEYSEWTRKDEKVKP